MKSIFFVALFVLIISASEVIAADKKEEVTVKTVSASSVVTSKGSNTNDTGVRVIQIYDSKNGVVCYGIVSTSDKGKGPSGGYPGTSIDCILLKKQ